MKRRFQRVPPSFGSSQDLLVKAEEEVEDNPLKQFFSTAFYQALVVEAFGAIVIGIGSAVSTYYVTRWLEQRERKARRKNGRRRRR